MKWERVARVTFVALAACWLAFGVITLLLGNIASANMLRVQDHISGQTFLVTAQTGRISSSTGYTYEWLGRLYNFFGDAWLALTVVLLPCTFVRTLTRPAPPETDKTHQGRRR
jgi:hypothetical protein